MIPVAPTKLGPMCIPGPKDDPKAPNSCDPKNNPTTPCGCTPCPQTPGSDCSRCDNCYEEPAFPPHVHDGKAVSGVGPVVGITDVVKVPSHLAPGKYVLGWRYDCEATGESRATCRRECVRACCLLQCCLLPPPGCCAQHKVRLLRLNSPRQSSAFFIFDTCFRVFCCP